MKTKSIATKETAQVVTAFMPGEASATPKNLRSRAELLAGDQFWIGNWKYPGAEEAFPSEPWMRTVERYFERAEGGPLLIDEPIQPHQIERCERKREVMNKLGLQYLVLLPHATEYEDRLELSKCRGQLQRKP